MLNAESDIAIDSNCFNNYLQQLFKNNALQKELNTLHTVWCNIPSRFSFKSAVNSYYYNPTHYDTLVQPSYNLGTTLRLRIEIVTTNYRKLNNLKNLGQSLKPHETQTILLNLIRGARLVKLSESTSVFNDPKTIAQQFSDVLDDTVKLDEYDQKFIQENYPNLANALPKMIFYAAAASLSQIATNYSERKAQQANNTYFFTSPFTFLRSLYQKKFTGTTSELTRQHVNSLQTTLDQFISKQADKVDDLTFDDVNTILQKSQAMLYCAGIFLAKEKPALTNLTPISAQVIGQAITQLVVLLYLGNPKFPLPIQDGDDDLTMAAKRLITRLHHRDNKGWHNYNYYHRIAHIKTKCLGSIFDACIAKENRTGRDNNSIADDYRMLSEAFFSTEYRDQKHDIIYQSRHLHK